MAKDKKDLAVFESLMLKNAFSVKKFKKYLILLHEANFSQILYNLFILKNKVLLILGHPTHSGPPLNPLPPNQPNM
jgi:hypothetical protein